VICVNIQRKLRDFSLDVNFESDAHMLGVFGPSGAGKTMLIRMIAGLERPDSGSIIIDGKTMFDRARGVDVPSHRRRVGVVFQEHRLFPHYTVRGNLLYGARGNTAALQSTMDLLELQLLTNRRIDELSGGERQRVALGRALLSQPNVLLLDEPLVSLDHRLRGQILPYLRRVQDALTIPVLYVSHELQEILQLTNHMLVLDGGRVAGHGQFSALAHHDAVLSVVHDRGMTNIVRARVAERRADEGVDILAIIPSSGARQQPMTQLIAPIASNQVGEEVMISIQPWDVALAAQPVQGVSIQNQVMGVVNRCTAHDRRVLVEVDIGVPILVEISRRSASAMNIETGRTVICLIKSHAIRHVGAEQQRTPLKAKAAVS